MKQLQDYLNLFAAIVAAILLSGCASFMSTPDTHVGEYGEYVNLGTVHSGDYVVAQLADGGRVEGVVGTIWERAVMIGDSKIWEHEIDQLFRVVSRSESSPARLLIVGVLIGTIVYIVWTVSRAKIPA